MCSPPAYIWDPYHHSSFMSILYSIRYFDMHIAFDIMSFQGGVSLYVVLDCICFDGFSSQRSRPVSSCI